MTGASSRASAAPGAAAPATSPPPDAPGPPGLAVAASGLGRTFDLPTPWPDRLRGRTASRGLAAVADVDLAIAPGRTLGMVGESGCGKSTLARLMVGLEAPDAGHVRLDGADLHATLAGPRAAARTLRRRLQMVFQDPYASLDPRWRIADIVTEALTEQGLVRRADVPARAAALLAAVGLPDADLRRFPHQFSGGQRQRIAIARALATSPAFLVCDEPTSALDVSVQAQVLNLLVDLQHARGMTMLFISHDLVVVRYVADAVGVMLLGRVVELAPTAALFAAPRHPYTRMLMTAMPDPRGRATPLEPVRGEAADALAPPSGCAFHPRCAHADARCRAERPLLLPAGEARVACHAIEEGRLGP